VLRDASISDHSDKPWSAETVHVRFAAKAQQRIIWAMLSASCVWAFIVSISAC
jgi:hypothetical protein